MFPHESLEDEFFEQDIMRYVPTRTQAMLSKKYRKLAQYRSINYDVQPEEVASIDGDRLYVVAGTARDHVLTIWKFLYEHDGTDVQVLHSVRVIDGWIREEFVGDVIARFRVREFK